MGEVSNVFCDWLVIVIVSLAVVVVISGGGCRCVI